MFHLTVFLLEEPRGEGHLYSRCHGVYSGMTSLNFGGPQVSQLVINNPGSYVLPASVFPSESPKASVTCSIFMCRQMKLEPDMLYAGRPSVPSLLYIPPLDLTYQRACRWGRREGEGNVRTSPSSVCCSRC